MTPIYRLIEPSETIIKGDSYHYALRPPTRQEVQNRTRSTVFTKVTDAGFARIGVTLREARAERPRWRHDKDRCYVRRLLSKRTPKTNRSS